MKPTRKTELTAGLTDAAGGAFGGTRRRTLTVLPEPFFKGQLLAASQSLLGFCGNEEPESRSVVILRYVF
jgi:hypothetical protein